jgi:hypothetical protein
MMNEGLTVQMCSEKISMPRHNAPITLSAAVAVEARVLYVVLVAQRTRSEMAKVQ